MYFPPWQCDCKIEASFENEIMQKIKKRKYKKSNTAMVLFILCVSPFGSIYFGYLILCHRHGGDCIHRYLSQNNTRTRRASAFVRIPVHAIRDRLHFAHLVSPCFRDIESLRLLNNHFFFIVCIVVICIYIFRCYYFFRFILSLVVCGSVWIVRYQLLAIISGNCVVVDSWPYYRF